MSKSSNGIENKEKPFRFKKACIRENEYEQHILEAWQTYFKDERVSNVAHKNACVGKHLNFWSRDYLRHMGYELKRAQKEMEDLQKMSPQKMLCSD